MSTLILWNDLSEAIHLRRTPLLTIGINFEARRMPTSSKSDNENDDDDKFKTTKTKKKRAQK